MKMSNPKKSPASRYGWQVLPDHIFKDIMMMVGLNNSRRNYLSDLFSKCNLEDMHKCRQVSQSWNVKISQITKYKKGTIKTNADNLASHIRKK